MCAENFEFLKNKLDTTVHIQDKVAVYVEIVYYLTETAHEIAQEYIEEGLLVAEKAKMHTHTVFLLFYEIMLSKFLPNAKKQADLVMNFVQQLKKIEHLGVFNYFVAALFSILPINHKDDTSTKRVLLHASKSIFYFRQQPLTKSDLGFEPNFELVLYELIFFTHTQNQDFEQAKTALDIATFFTEQQNTPANKAQNLIHWTLYYFYTNDFKTCFQYLQEAITALQKVKKEGNMRFLQLYAIQGKIYLNFFQSYENAEKSFQEALRLSNHFGFKFATADLYYQLSKVYKAQKNLIKAYETAEKSVQAHLAQNLYFAGQHITAMGQLIQQENQNYTKIWDAFVENLENNPIVGYKNQFGNWNNFEFYEFLTAHIQHHDIGVEYIAKKFNMSSRTLNRYVHMFFGTSTQKLLNFIRMQQARFFLLQTSKSISEIAFLVGFEHFSHFAMSFKKQFGVSPSAYRLSEK